MIRHWTKLALCVLVSGMSAACAATVQPRVMVEGLPTNGKTKITAQLQAALDQAAAAGGGEVVLPAGKFVTGSVTLPSDVTLRLSKDAVLIGSPDAADYPLMDVRWEGRWRQGHRALISASKAHKIAIVGEGKMQGDMAIGNLRNPRGPCIFEPIECDDVRIEGISIEYRRMWAIHPTYCTNVLAKNLFIRSTRANGDGIDVDSCKDVRIDGCDIDTGDDSIAIKSGRGMEAFKIARPTENVLITNCKLGSDFAGLALGTEISGGVKNIRVEDTTFTHGSNSIFIKSRDGRGAYMTDISGKNLTCTASSFLRIDLLNRGIQDSEPVPAPDALTKVSKIHFSNVTANCPVAVDVTSSSPEAMIDGLTLSDISGKCPKGLRVSNVKNADLSNITLTGFYGPLMTVENVTGKGIDELLKVPAGPTTQPEARAAGTRPAATKPAN